MILYTWLFILTVGDNYYDSQKIFLGYEIKLLDNASAKIKFRISFPRVLKSVML